MANRAAIMVDVTPMPISSSAPVEHSGSCPPVLAASFETSAARSRATRRWTERFAPPLESRLQDPPSGARQRGRKIYSLHAPEVERIGKGKARAPYEFVCKVCIVTPVTAPTRYTRGHAPRRRWIATATTRVTGRQAPPARCRQD